MSVDEFSVQLWFKTSTIFWNVDKGQLHVIVTKQASYMWNLDLTEEQGTHNFKMTCTTFDELFKVITSLTDLLHHDQGSQWGFQIQLMVSSPKAA